MTRPRHAFIVRDAAPITPLGAPAAESWLLGGRLHEQMRASLEAAGLAVELVDTIDLAEERASACPDGALVTHDSVAFSSSVLQRFLAAAERAPAGSALTAALPDVESIRRLAHIDGLHRATVDGAPVWTAPLHALTHRTTLAEARPVLLPFKQHIARGPVPPGMIGEREVAIGMSDAYLCRVDHWLHILRVNQAALGATWIERGNTLGGKLWYLWRALLGFPWTRGRLVTAIRRLHPRAKVHHSAHGELSVVEEGAEIGVNAIVKGSWVGKGAHIDDGAIVNGCVIGAGAFVASSASVNFSVLYPESFAAQQKMQLSILGEGSVAFTGSYFYDLNFERNVRIEHRGRIVDSGERFASVCMGPHSRVAGGVWIASGREIPAGALIIQPPGGVAHVFDHDLATTRITTIRDRKLIDVGPLPGTARPALLKKPDPSADK